MLAVWRERFIHIAVSEIAMPGAMSMVIEVLADLLEGFIMAHWKKFIQPGV